MSWTPIQLSVIQYQNPADNTPYSGAVLKAFATGTTTPILMATDNTGGTTFSSVALNASGFPENSGSIVIPHINEDYKLALFATQAAADANTPAIWSIDKLVQILASLAITSTATTADILNIIANSLTTGNAIRVSSDSASFTATDGLINFILDNTSATGRVISVKNDGTGDALFIDQNGNGIALNIDSESTTVDAVQIILDALTTGIGVDLSTNNATFSGSSGLLRVLVDNTSATGKAFKIQNDGTGDGLFIDQNGNGISLNIDSESTTVDAVNIVLDALTTGSGIDLSTNNASFSSSNGLIRLLVDNTSASGNAFRIQNKGTGDAVFIDQDGNGFSIRIDSESTTVDTINVQCDVITSAIGFDLRSNSSSFSGTEGFLRVQLQNSSATGVAAKIVNEGTGNGLFIDQNGNGVAFNIDSESTTADAMNVECDTLTTAIGFDLKTNNATFSGTNGLLRVLVDNTSATGNAFRIKNDGTGDGQFIDQNGNAIALNIDSESTTANAVTIVSEVTTGTALDITADNITTGIALKISSSSTTFASGANLLDINLSDGFASDAAVKIANNGLKESISIVHTGVGDGLLIDNNHPTTGITFKTVSLATGFNWLMDSKHASAPQGMEIDFSAASPDNNTQKYLNCIDSTTTRCIIWADGDLANHDGTYGSISDRKLKTDILDAPDYWDRFKSLTLHTYKMKTDIDQFGDQAPNRLGLIHDEVLAVFPSLAPSSPDTEKVVTGKNPVVRMKLVQETIDVQVMIDEDVPEVLDDDGNVAEPATTKKVNKTKRGAVHYEEVTSVRMIDGKMIRVVTPEHDVTEDVDVFTTELVFDENGDPVMVEVPDLYLSGAKKGQRKFDNTGDDLIEEIPTGAETGWVKDSIIYGAIQASVVQQLMLKVEELQAKVEVLEAA